MTEWTEWRLHDGKGCPCIGQWVESVSADGEMLVHIAHGVIRGPWSAWKWIEIPPHLWGGRIIRYRIRRPKALNLCREIAALKGQRVDA